MKGDRINGVNPVFLRAGQRLNVLPSVFPVEIITERNSGFFWQSYSPARVGSQANTVRVYKRYILHPILVFNKPIYC
jgi:hypothetical protein